MIAGFVLLAALLGAPETTTQQEMAMQAEPARAKRPVVAFGAEAGLHNMAGNGLLLSLNPTGKWTLDGGFGWAPAGLTGGLRGRYNFLRGAVRPFVGAGVSHSFGATRHLDDRPYAFATIDVPHSTYAQVLGGVSYVRQGGLFLMGGVGYQRLLGDSNVRVRSGVISKQVFLRESAWVGSGLALSVAAGYAL